MVNVHELFQAFVAPAIFVSAESLLILSLNSRMMGFVSRLRSYLHEKHNAARQGRSDESEAYASQIRSIQKRAEMVRCAFVLTLYGLLGTVATCLILGAGLYWRWAESLAAVVFVISVLSTMAGLVYYVREVQVALSSGREEAADSRFMDVRNRAEVVERRKVRHGT